MEKQVIAGLFLLLFGIIVVLIKISNKDVLDLTSKDESKLSEEGINEPEYIAEVHEESNISKPKRVRKTVAKKEVKTTPSKSKKVKKD